MRWITFDNPYLCDEYDTLAFPISEADATIEYEHLAGNSYIPNENIEDVIIKVIQETGIIHLTRGK